ncbi:MAG: EamA/RhaT family transporter [Bacteroidia bacterium]|nr:EamA/RhaT family transporter [Bacteroidia bacterium]
MSIILLLSIICASFLFIVFKYFKVFGIDSSQGIVFNYFTASACSFFLNYTINVYHLAEVSIIWQPALMIGFLFILVFNLTSITTRKLGLAVASVAAKMSVVIPVSVGIFLYSEQPGIIRIIGIGIALLAVFFISSGNKEETTSAKEKNGWAWLLPAALFLGTGLVDGSIKYAQAEFMNDGNRYLVMSVLFGFAGTIGLIKLMFDYVKRQAVFAWKNVLGGICLGLFNYFSLHFLVICLEEPGAQSAIIFAVLNVGIVLTSTLYAILIFKEKLSLMNKAGILFALAAMVMLLA